MLKTRKNKGITLIALVITIIILIILAGITINAVFGESGLISKAKEAAFKTEVSNIRDIIEIKRIQIEKTGEIALNEIDLENISDISIAQKNKYITGGKKLVVSGNKLCYYNEEDSEFSQTQKDWLEQIGIGPAGDEDINLPLEGEDINFQFDLDMGAVPMKIKNFTGDVSGSNIITFNGEFDFLDLFERLLQAWQDELLDYIENDPNFLQDINEMSDLSFTTIAELKAYVLNNASATDAQLAQRLLIMSFKQFVNGEEGFGANEIEISSMNDIKQFLEELFSGEAFFNNLLEIFHTCNYEVKVTKPNGSQVTIALSDTTNEGTPTYFEIYSNGTYIFQFIPPEENNPYIIIPDIVSVQITDYPGGDTGNYSVRFHSKGVSNIY